MAVFSRLIAASVLLSSLALSGCAALGPAPYPLSMDEMDNWYDAAREAVEKDRGVDLGHARLSTVNTREMLFVLSELYARRVDPNMRSDVRVKVFAGEAFASVATLQAVYDPWEDRIIVNTENLALLIGRMTPADIDPRAAALTVLLHELNHAADDVIFDLLAIQDATAGDHLGAHMIAEGHAELATERQCRQIGCAKAFEFSHAELHGLYHGDQHPETVAVAIAGNVPLLYGRGYDFARELLARDQSGVLLQEAMLSPPGDVLSYFDSATFPNRHREKRREAAFDVLSRVDLGGPDSRWLKVPQSAYADRDIPLGESRESWVADELQAVAASAQMQFVDQDARELDSVLIVLYEMKDSSQAGERLDAFREEISEAGERSKSTGGRVAVVADDALGNLARPLAEQSEVLALRFAEGVIEDDSFELYNSLHREGRYLLRVINRDNPQLNSLASQRAIAELRVMLAGEANGVNTGALSN